MALFDVTISFEGRTIFPSIRRSSSSGISSLCDGGRMCGHTQRVKGRDAIPLSVSCWVIDKLFELCQVETRPQFKFCTIPSSQRRPWPQRYPSRQHGPNHSILHTRQPQDHHEHLSNCSLWLGHCGRSWEPGLPDDSAAASCSHRPESVSAKTRNKMGRQTGGTTVTCLKES